MLFQSELGCLRHKTDIVADDLSESGDKADQNRSYPDTCGGQDQGVDRKKITNCLFHVDASFTAIRIPVLLASEFCD
jgi:hypothetical protein